MNSPLALVLAGAGGLGLLVGGWYLTATIREPERVQSLALRLFGAACLVIAGQEYAALSVYRAVDPESYLGAVRLHTVFAPMAPVAIIWFVALYTDMAARWLLWTYTGFTATVMVLNLASPTTMHFSDLLEVGGVVLPWGERIAQATAIPSRWPPLGGLSDHRVWGLVRVCPFHGLWPQRRPVENTAGGRTRRSHRHHRSRTPRSTASVSLARGRVRVSRIRDRAGIRAAPQTGLGGRPCRRRDR